MGTKMTATYDNLKLAYLEENIYEKMKNRIY